MVKGFGIGEEISGLRGEKILVEVMRAKGIMTISRITIRQVLDNLAKAFPAHVSAIQW